MATEIANAYIALTTKMPGLKSEVEGALSEADGAVEDSGRRHGTGWAKGLAVALVAGTAVVAAAAGAMAVKVVSSFAEFEQNLGGSEAVFGEYAASVQKTGEEAYKNLGISQSDYLATANKMGALFQGSGVEQVRALDLTRDAMQRAADMASVMGIDMGVAMESVAGAAKGNFTMMDNLGVAMNATTIESYAASKGMEDWSYATATSAEKAEIAMSMFMDSTSQYAGNFAREATETVSGSMGMLGAAWEELLTGLGSGDADMSQLTQNLAGAVEAVIANVAPIVANLFQSLPDTIGQLFSALGPIIEEFIYSLDMEPLTVFYDTVKNIFTFIQDNMWWIGPLAAGIGIVAAAVVVWTAAQWLLNAALTANPIGLIIVGIGLLIGAIILLVQNWDTVVAWFVSTWEGLIASFQTGGDQIITWWNDLWTTVWEFIVSVWTTIVDWVVGVWNGLIANFERGGAQIAGWWDGLWSGIASFFGGIWDGILSTIRGVQDAFGRVFEAIGGIVRGAFDGVVGFIKGVINGIVDAVNGVIGGINSVAGAVGGAIGLDISIPKIPKLADGGIITGSRTGTLALVGEAGRGRDEAVVPLPPDWRTNGIGGGSPSTLVFVDADGRLIGSMKAAAASVVESARYKSAVKLSSGGVSA